MTNFDDYLLKLNDAISNYNGDNLPQFAETVESLQKIIGEVNESYVPKERFDELTNAYKQRFKEDFLGFPNTESQAEETAEEEAEDVEEAAVEQEEAADSAESEEVSEDEISYFEN